MNNNFLVPTGNIIKEYLDEYGISQKELSNRAGISEKHISNVIKGNSRLTEEFALKLEKVLTGVPASYWLNYEAKYRESLAREEEYDRVNNWDLAYLSTRFRFKEVFKGLNLTLIEQAIAMLKLLKISDFSNFDKVYGNLAVDFMEDGGEHEAIAIWLNLCEAEVEIQNKDLEDIPYKENELKKALSKFKLLSNNNVTKASINSCRKLCNKLGINLVFFEPITNSKVRGALTTYKNHPTIYLSGRFKSHSHIWFAFMHEIGHLILHYNKDETLISYEDQDENNKEEDANEFARDFFINASEYKQFIHKRSFTVEDIKKFAISQGVLPEFVVARLQHDNEIRYDQFTHIH
ncbi:MAG: ImmA/IrrE family metallo-endopeptidase [Lachnospiraceae bacterium]|nr:ImmA/IrrE family metallo-endopeptidase [Lachnospiraceae bacterium]